MDEDTAQQLQYEAQLLEEKYNEEFNNESI